MKLRVLTPIHEPALLMHNRLTLPLLIQVYAVGGLGYPLQPVVNWFEASVVLPQWDGTPDFWSPYGVVPSGAAYVKPWASVAASYLYRKDGPVLKDLVPEDWRRNVANLIADLTYTDPEVLQACEVMRSEYLEPAGRDKDRITLHDQLVMQALNQSRMTYDRKAAADAERLGSYHNTVRVNL